MRVIPVLIICLLGIMNQNFAQNEMIDLWKEAIPNSRISDEQERVEVDEIVRISRVQKPTLEIFLPAKRAASGRAIIICPGGGYTYLSYDWEGTDIAKWFNGIGVAAFVLKYRLPDSKSVKTSYEAPLQDAQRAIRIVRSRAEEWHIDPNKIGVIGFSAGGHLACTLGTQFATPNNFKETSLDSLSARPDFMALIYPVITMKSDYTHKGSQRSLLGMSPDKRLIDQYSNEIQVTSYTPPTFIVHAQDDDVVPVENSIRFYKALKENKVPAEMHLYPSGGHGYALAINQDHLNTWPERLREWLQNL